MCFIFVGVVCKLENSCSFCVDILTIDLLVEYVDDGEDKPKKEFKPKTKADKPKNDKAKQAKKEETEEPKEKK